MREKAFYPGRIWDGTSDTRKDPYGNTLGINRAPDYSDWDQLLAEVISMQESIAGGGVLHVKQFGAVGDGIADDTMAIAMAMIAASQTFEALWFGPGLFSVSNPIDLASNVTIYGAGIDKTTIQSVGNGTVFNYNSESDTLVNSAIRDLTINGKVEIVPPALNDPANLRLSNLKINGNFLHLKNVTDFILDGILTNYGGILLENCDFGVLNRVSMLNSPEIALKILTAFGLSGNILAISSGNSGVRAETINNCDLRIYSKWNTGNQIYVGNSSKGSQIRAFCLGNSDSETGLYIENSENITIGGLFGYHTVQDIYLAASSTNINVRNPSFFGTSPQNLVDYSNSHLGGGGTGTGLDSFIPTKGNILVGDGANWVTRPIGTNWQFMTVQSNDAEWTDVTTDNISQGSTNKYWANALFDARFGVKTTDDLQEGDSNHYYSSSHFNSDFASKSTDNLAEGSVNHYYSDALFQSSFADQTTDDLQQGLTNLYFNASNFRDLLPSMTGHSAEFLSNNGSDLLWSPISISLVVPSGFSVSGNGTNNGDITISMSKTGILKGVGNGIDVATADVDYSTPGHTHVLSQILDWPDPTGDSGYFLATNGTGYYWAPNGSGTVTSIGLIVPSGFSASDPITTSGNITISTTLSGMIKGTGSGFTAATAGVDYADASHDHTLSDITNWPTPASGQFLSYNGSVYTFAPVAINISVPSGFGVDGGPTNNGTINITSSLSGIIKGTGGGFVAATPGVDYVAGAHTHPIADITDFPSQTSHSGAFLTTNGSALSWGTVSVGVDMPGGFSVSGPVSNGTITVSTTLSGIIKGDGTGFTVATAGVDYAAAGHTHTTGQITNWPDPTGHNGQFLTTDGSNYSWGSAGGAPSTSKYILQVADAALPNAQALGALATGLLKSTTTTGVLSIATASDIPDLSATYQTVSGMSSYLTTATAASTYQTQAGMSSYLTTATAASTYLKIAPASTTEASIKGGAYDGASLIVKNATNQFFNEVFIVANKAGTKKFWIGAYNDGNFSINLDADGLSDGAFNFAGASGASGTGNMSINWGNDKLSAIKCGMGYNTPNRMSLVAYAAIEVRGNRQSQSAPGFTSGTSTTATAGFNVVNDTRDQIAQAIRGYSTQTKDLLQWQKSDGTVYGSITNTGIALTPGTLTAAANHYSIVATWNSSSVAFNGFFANITATAYLSSSRLINLQVASTSIFAISPVGYTTLSGNMTITGNASTYAGAPTSVLSLKAHATPSNYGLLDLQNSAGAWLGGVNSSMVPHGILAEDICTGRLTLSSTDPCPSADQTAKTTVYFLPYMGKGRILLYNSGSTFYEQYDFTSLSIALTSYTANKNYDVFVYLNNGVPDLYTLVWTNDTTRATGLSNSGDFWYLSTDQGKRYVGTIRITGTTGQCEDSVLNRFVFNMHNRIPRRMYWSSSGSAWTFSTTSTIRILNNGSAHCKIVNGSPAGAVSSWWNSNLKVSAITTWASTAIAVDMGLAGQYLMGPYSISAYNGITNLIASGNSDIGLGYHTVSLTEQTGGSMTADYGGTALNGHVMM